MDSPLLPTFKRKADVTSSPTGLMANMTLEPMSPGDSFMFSHQPSTSRLGSSEFSHTSQNASSNSVRASTSTAPVPPAKTGKAPRFSLFAPNQGPSTRADDDADDEAEAQRDFDIAEEDEEAAGDETVLAANEPAADRAESSAVRDDKLRESLYELRQMNEVFEGFLGALEASKGHNEVRYVRQC